MDRHFNIRMPLDLFQALARQAAERGLPVGAFIRSQLAVNIDNPTNIHKIARSTEHAR